MKMTPINTGLFVLMIGLGVWIGLRYPVVGLVLLIPMALLVAIILLRNKSGTMATAEETADALAMKISSDKARLFIMRNGFVGGQQGMNITLNGQLESQIRSKYFLMVDLDPGTHDVKAKMASGSESAARNHKVNLSAGDVVVLDMKLNMGVLQGTPDFTEIVGVDQARQALAGCRLVHWKSGDARPPASIVGQ